MFGEFGVYEAILALSTASRNYIPSSVLFSFLLYVCCLTWQTSKSAVSSLNPGPIALSQHLNVEESTNNRITSMMIDASENLAIHATDRKPHPTEISEFAGQCGQCGHNLRLCMGVVSSTGAWAMLLCRACAAAARRSLDPSSPPLKVLSLRGRCIACPRRATFGALPGRAHHCKRHRLPGEEDTANRRCRAPGCPRQPAYGDSARGVPLYCAAHRAANHTNLKRRLCQNPEVRAPCLPNAAGRRGGGGWAFSLC